MYAKKGERVQRFLMLPLPFKSHTKTSDSYARCLNKIDQFLEENDHLPGSWQKRFVETHLRLLKIFVSYPGKWSDEDKAACLRYQSAVYLQLEDMLDGNNFCDYVSRFILSEPTTVVLKNKPKLRFRDCYVPLDFQANIAKTCKNLLSLSTQPPVMDALELSHFSESVQDYVVSLWLELRLNVQCGKLKHSFCYVSVKENYRATARWLGYFKSFISSLVEQLIDQKKLKKLLALAGALVLRVATVACENQIINRRKSDFSAQMELRSGNLSDIIYYKCHDIYGEVLGAYVDFFEAEGPSFRPSRRPFISTITFEYLLESYANIYQLVDSQVNILLPVLGNLCSIVVEHDFNEKLKLLLRHGVSAVREARLLIGSTPLDILLSELCHKLNLIKAEIFVLELYSQTYLMFSTKDRVATINNACKFLNIFFKTPEIYMKGCEKSILSLIEALLREAGRGSSCSSPDQSQKFDQEDLISISSLKIFMLFKAEAMLAILNDSETTLKFLERYSLEILQKCLIFLRALLDQEDREVSTNSGVVASEAVNLVFSLGGGEMEHNKLLPNSFFRIFELNFAKIRTVHAQCPWLLSTFPKSDGLVFVDFLFRKLSVSLEDNPSNTTMILEDQAQVLLQELQFFQSFIKDVKQKNMNESEDSGGSRMQCLIYEAEYIILNLFEDGGVPIWYKQLALLNAIAEAKLINAEIQEYHRDSEGRHHGAIINAVRQTSVGSNNSRTDEVIIGFEERAKDIEEQLKFGSPKRQIVSIVGMGGVGKTTLAKKVYSSISIQHHFRARAWCTVSQAYRKRELLLEILGCMVEITEKIKKMNGNDIADALRRSLKGKRYLVVMDDIWSKEAWEDMQTSLPDDGIGSRILFTSRISELALDGESYHLPLLTAEESWNLFKEKLFHGGSCPEELLQVGRLIVKNCKRLPLAIVVIAGLLEKIEMKKDLWEEIAADLMSRIAHDDDGDTRFMDVLEFSYNHLPSHLKPCFLYLGMFSEDQEIQVQKLKWMWIAEGFVPEIDSKSSEETAEEYLMELIGRNLVMEAQRRSREGVKTCRVHDMVRFLCLEKARKENFVQLITKMDCVNSKTSSALVSSSYRICFQSKRQSVCTPVDPHLHSLLFYPANSGGLVFFVDNPLQLQNAKFLRVLDTRYVEIKPPSLEQFELMRFLTYLSVRGHFSDVPSSIAQLVNLETLILKGSENGIKVSNQLWCMGKLRHIHIHFINVSSLPGPEIGNLEHIVTLSLLTILSPNPGETFLKRLIGIKKLKCQFDRDWRTDYWGSNALPAMDTLYQLESLSLSCFCAVVSFPNELMFPENLKKLTLRDFNLPLGSISAIGELRNLEVLKLLDCKGVYPTWDMKEGEFQKLKYLGIQGLAFANWNTSDDPFPLLERLVLKDCVHLVKVPTSFGEIPTLQMIVMNNCNEFANKSVEIIYEQQLDFGNEEFKVLIAGQRHDDEEDMVDFEFDTYMASDSSSSKFESDDDYGDVTMRQWDDLPGIDAGEENHHILLA